MMLKILGLTSFICGMYSSVAAATVLDFEELSSAQIRKTIVSRFTGDVFMSGGFEFRSIDTVFAYGPLNSNRAKPNSGSVSLNVQGLSSSSGEFRSGRLTMRKENAESFSVQNLRVAEGRTFVKLNGGDPSAFGSTALSIQGSFASGGSISYVHHFDGIADHRGPADDFELVQLTGFQNLSSLTLTGLGGANNGYSFSVDDILVGDPTPVPLPAGLLLLTTAIFGFGLTMRKRG